MQNKESILEKVNFLLKKSISKSYDATDLQRIISYTKEHSDNLTVGKIFGYSISEYAFATLKWIGSSETLSFFDELTNTLPKTRLQSVNELIEKKLYLQY